MSDSAKKRPLAAARAEPGQRLAEVEQALRESQQLLASITTNIAEAIFRRSLTEGLLFVNEAYVRMFGYRSGPKCARSPRKSSTPLRPDALKSCNASSAMAA